MPAAVACRRALDYWGSTCDPKGRGTYQQVQAWYHRHALRSAALGAIVPDLFIRRCGDHVELSWTANPPPFSHEGLTFQSGAGHVRLPVANLAQPLWGVLQWVKESPPDLPEGYREDWATLCGKIDELEQLDAGAFHRAYVPHRVLQPAKDAFEQIQRLDLFVDRRSANELYVEEFSPAVAMFGGLSSALALLDIQRLRDALVAGFPGEDSVSYANSWRPGKACLLARHTLMVSALLQIFSAISNSPVAATSSMCVPFARVLKSQSKKSTLWPILFVVWRWRERDCPPRSWLI